MKNFVLFNILFITAFLVSCKLTRADLTTQGQDMVKPEEKVDQRKSTADEMLMTDSEKVETGSSESPFACNIQELSQEQRQRYASLSEGLKSDIQEVKELSDGYAFRLKSDSQNIVNAAEWISYERMCCPFFDFEVHIERNDGALWVLIKGREGIKPFIKSELGI